MTPVFRIAIGAVIFVCGAAICLWTGRLGFMPLDQSIVFDAGWRILGGQVPYQDFVTPTAVIPGAMQAVFFSVLGISWFSYVLHAAVLNGAFAVLVLAILLRTGSNTTMAAACALASAVLFYAPMGTPYPEQHSLFFIVAALACVFLPHRPVSAQLGLMAAPLLAICAVMSKQNPGLAGAAVVLVACAWPQATLPASRQWRAFGIGAAVALVLVVWVTTLWSAHETFLNYFWTMPNEEAARRGLTTAGALASVFDWRTMGWAGFFWLRPLPVVLLLVTLVCAARAITTPALLRSHGLTIVVALGLYAVTVVLMVYTRNQVQNAVGLIPLVVGLGVRPEKDTGFLFPARVLKKKPGIFFSVIAIVAVGLDTVNFHRQVNQTRMVLDLTYDARQPAPALPPALSSLRWQTSGIPYDASGLATLLSFLKSQPGNILVLGDSVYLYALTGRPSANPNLWYHPGLTIPTGGAAAQDFERRFEHALDTYRPRFLVMESYRTWRGFVPMAYPPLRRWFDAHGCREIDVAPRMQVFECR